MKITAKILSMMRVLNKAKIWRMAASAAICTMFFMTSIIQVSAVDADEYGGYKADTLTVNVGYYGGPYYEKKVFTLDELQKMNLVKADYTVMDNLPSVVIDHVIGVRLSDVVDASGIDLGSVRKFYFYTKDKDGDPYNDNEDYTKKSLIDTRRYCYYSLPDNFDNDTGTVNEYASLDKVPVDTVIALSDDWKRCIEGASFGSDYLNLNSNTRYRLVFGQENAEDRKASQSAKWIHSINVELGGSPTLGLTESNLSGKVGSVLHTEASLQAADSLIAQNAEIGWASSDTDIASVDENGNVTINGEGTAKITATYTKPDGSTITATATVNGDGNGESGNPLGTGTQGSGQGSGTADSGKTQKSSGSKSTLTELSTDNTNRTDSSKADHYELVASDIQSESNEGGVQNWRMYEMSEDAQELNIQQEDNPLLGFTGAAAVALLGSGILFGAARFFLELKGGKHVFKY